jgi:hypothetical protein
MTIIILLIFLLIVLLCYVCSSKKREGYIEIPQPQNSEAERCRADCNSYVDSFVCTYVPPLSRAEEDTIPYPLPTNLDCDKNFILGECYKRCPSYSKDTKSDLVLMKLLSDPFEALNEV